MRDNPQSEAKTAALVRETLQQLRKSVYDPPEEWRMGKQEAHLRLRERRPVFSPTDRGHHIRYEFGIHKGPRPAKDLPDNPNAESRIGYALVSHYPNPPGPYSKHEHKDEVYFHNIQVDGGLRSLGPGTLSKLKRQGEEIIGNVHGYGGRRVGGVHRRAGKPDTYIKNPRYGKSMMGKEEAHLRLNSRHSYMSKDHPDHEVQYVFGIHAGPHPGGNPQDDVDAPSRLGRVSVSHYPNPPGPGSFHQNKDAVHFHGIKVRGGLRSLGPTTIRNLKRQGEAVIGNVHGYGGYRVGGVHDRFGSPSTYVKNPQYGKSVTEDLTAALLRVNLLLAGDSVGSGQGRLARAAGLFKAVSREEPKKPVKLKFHEHDREGNYREYHIHDQHGNHLLTMRMGHVPDEQLTHIDYLGHPSGSLASKVPIGVHGAAQVYDHIGDVFPETKWLEAFRATGAHDKAGRWQDTVVPYRPRKRRLSPARPGMGKALGKSVDDDDDPHNRATWRMGKQEAHLRLLYREAFHPWHHQNHRVYYHFRIHKGKKGARGEAGEQIGSVKITHYPNEPGYNSRHTHAGEVHFNWVGTDTGMRSLGPGTIRKLRRQGEKMIAGIRGYGGERIEGTHHRAWDLGHAEDPETFIKTPRLTHKEVHLRPKSTAKRSTLPPDHPNYSTHHHFGIHVGPRPAKDVKDRVSSPGRLGEVRVVHYPNKPDEHTPHDRPGQLLFDWSHVKGGKGGLGTKHARAIRRELDERIPGITGYQRRAWKPERESQFVNRPQTSKSLSDETTEALLHANFLVAGHLEKTVRWRAPGARRWTARRGGIIRRGPRTRQPASGVIGAIHNVQHVAAGAARRPITLVAPHGAMRARGREGDNV